MEQLQEQNLALRTKYVKSIERNEELQRANGVLEEQSNAKTCKINELQSAISKLAKEVQTLTASVAKKREKAQDLSKQYRDVKRQNQTLAIQLRDAEAYIAQLENEMNRYREWDKTCEIMRRDISEANRKLSQAEQDLAVANEALRETNEQLLEAVQQKLRMSRELEQWKLDAQELIDAKVQQQLKENPPKVKKIAPTPTVLSKEATRTNFWNVLG